MLFNSHLFIFLFLPIVLTIFYFIGARNSTFALAWLSISSLFFYGWWNPAFLVLLLTSISVNFVLGRVISTRKSQNNRKLILYLGIIFNLLLIAYFKYANFLVGIYNFALGASHSIEAIILPLAISFFTFQQIAYLVDSYQRITEEHSFLHYLLFVTFFPQLIAGPIVHHSEMLPQFTSRSKFHLNPSDLAVGLTFFAIGLFKKLIFADDMAEIASPLFGLAQEGTQLSPNEAWTATFAYTLQIYFDFSGYSDMAIGLARMFSIKLPLNFNSPYKSDSIIDFWRRWHITLSRFLRDYLYISMGGNRKGVFRRYQNLFLTMLIGGLWHGAGFTFVVWGGLHGLYLILNHAWRWLKKSLNLEGKDIGLGSRCIYRLVTILAVMIAWVFFRAEDVGSAFGMLQSMANLDSMNISWEASKQTTEIFLLLLVALFLPNSQEMLAKFKPALEEVDSHPSRSFAALHWGPTPIRAIFTGVLLFVSIIFLNRTSEFIYFQF